MTGSARDDAVQIARLYGAIWRRFQPRRHRIAGADVTPRMLVVLRHLSASGPLTVGELARHLGTSRATSSELIDRLQERGLVARMRDERDARRVFVWLTEAGGQQVEALATRQLEDPFAVAISSLAPDMREQIISGLRALLEAAETNEDKPDRRAA